ncbi:hypothetical protein [uncultured Pseudacidovorax sp.]|uniref:hypothetical protein n=1 Tax=uncultured Pseudacidovorax sp. TaxID=679313 RepID=UPI0025D51D57|nr:hypothetical protein [uncultured Pseudacidovorax sp.]
MTDLYLPPWRWDIPPRVLLDHLNQQLAAQLHVGPVDLLIDPDLGDPLGTDWAVQEHLAVCTQDCCGPRIGCWLRPHPNQYDESTPSSLGHDDAGCSLPRQLAGTMRQGDQSITCTWGRRVRHALPLAGKPADHWRAQA